MSEVPSSALSSGQSAHCTPSQARALASLHEVPFALYPGGFSSHGRNAHPKSLLWRPAILQRASPSVGCSVAQFQRAPFTLWPVGMMLPGAVQGTTRTAGHGSLIQCSPESLPASPSRRSPSSSEGQLLVPPEGPVHTTSALVPQSSAEENLQGANPQLLTCPPRANGWHLHELGTVRPRWVTELWGQYPHF